MNYRYGLMELLLRPKRSIAGIISIALAIALFLSLQAYSSGYKEAARAPLTEIGVDIVAQREGKTPEEFRGIVFPHSSGPLNREEIETIKRMEGIEEISEGVFFWSFEENQLIVGLGFDSSQNFGPGRLRAGLKEGRFIEPSDKGVLLADISYAEQFGIQVGDIITIANESFSVIGLVDTSRAGQVANANVFLNLEDARRLSFESKNVQNVTRFNSNDSNILFVKAIPSKASVLAENMEEYLGQMAIITTPRTFDDVLGATYVLVDRFGVLVGTVGIIIAAFSLFRSAISSITERKKDIALMRAVGWSRREVRRQIIFETLSVSIIGGGIGILIAIGVSYILQFSKVTVPVPWELSPTPHFLPGGAKELALVVPLDAQITGILTMLSVLMTIGIGGLVCLWASKAATSIKPVEVWRND